MFSGSIPALVTPFRDGAIDEGSFRRLVDLQIEQGSSALVPCGTTGESSTISNAEHHRVVEICVEQAAGRVPVIAGCGSNDTTNALLHMTFAQKCGAAAALVVAPYYNRPNQDGIFAHYDYLSSHSDLPIVVYNVPARTVTDIRPETLARLAKLPSVVGIKDASGAIARVSEHRLGCARLPAMRVLEWSFSAPPEMPHARTVSEARPEPSSSPFPRNSCRQGHEGGGVHGCPHTELSTSIEARDGIQH